MIQISVRTDFSQWFYMEAQYRRRRFFQHLYYKPSKKEIYNVSKMIRFDVGFREIGGAKVM